MEMALVLAIDARYLHAFLIKLLYTGYRPKTLEAPYSAFLSLYAMLLNCPLELLLEIMMGGEV